LKAPAKSTAARAASKFGRGTGIPNPIDIHVGKRIRIRRALLGVSQKTLANALGLTFQQVQKYESGTNRVSASRLSAIAGILRAPISYFFEDFPTTNAKVSAADTARREQLEMPETLELVHLYYAIPDEIVRRRFLEMLKAVVQSAE